MGRRKIWVYGLISFVIALMSAMLTIGAYILPVEAATPAATDFSVQAGTDPWGTAFDQTGHIWVALPGCDPTPTCSTATPPGKINVYDTKTDALLHSYTLPANYAQALFLAVDAQGNVWFPMPLANAIGVLHPQTGLYQQWQVPTAGAGPWDVAIDTQGKVWFTEHYSNKIGSFDPKTQKFTEVATPAVNSVPYGITVDAANNIWFTENNDAVGLIGEYTAHGQLLEYKVRATPASGLTPHLIAVDPAGNIWWSEGFAGMIGRLRVSVAQPGTNNGITEYVYPRTCQVCGVHTSGISVDHNGVVWFADSLQNTIGSFPSTGTGSFTLYNSPTANSHVHDGVNVDPQDTIWFTEEFGNNLGYISQTVPQPPVPVNDPVPTKTPPVTNPGEPPASPTPTGGHIHPTPVPPTGPSGSGSGSKDHVPPIPTRIIAEDTFQHHNQLFWGRASDGHAWAGDANTSNTFSMFAQRGIVSHGGTNYSAVLGPRLADAEVVFSGSISNFKDTNLGAVLRWSDGNDWYKAYIDGNNLVVQKKVHGVATILGRYMFIASAHHTYTLRFRIDGNILQARVWSTGSPEPFHWFVTTTDNTFHSGFCGLRMLIQNGAVANITSFKALAE
ncbi:virginiamycin B lyase family protein [Dictyobacter kobayashii]|uniref:SMP-30/Gluconolactonase/LRE-like region domain-containing protein n=1 Tax=Dictyobacter kobayashii TaxID=2014872 RepID=A0A402AMV0_9CHLR|nr:hypothetical protein [Dictyobacter kobayashii]GCE20345.1 hypothetical protein KDK_41450 [Dictyobacter kobayashii]